MCVLVGCTVTCTISQNVVLHSFPWCTHTYCPVFVAFEFVARKFWNVMHSQRYTCTLYTLTHTWRAYQSNCTSFNTIWSKNYKSTCIYLFVCLLVCQLIVLFSFGPFFALKIVSKSRTSNENKTWVQCTAQLELSTVENTQTHTSHRLIPSHRKSKWLNRVDRIDWLCHIKKFCEMIMMENKFPAVQNSGPWCCRTFSRESLRCNMWTYMVWWHRHILHCGWNYVCRFKAEKTESIHLRLTATVDVVDLLLPRRYLFVSIYNFFFSEERKISRRYETFICQFIIVYLFGVFQYSVKRCIVVAAVATIFVASKFHDNENNAPVYLNLMFLLDAIFSFCFPHFRCIRKIVEQNKNPTNSYLNLIWIKRKWMSARTQSVAHFE